MWVKEGDAWIYKKGGYSFQTMLSKMSGIPMSNAGLISTAIHDEEHTTDWLDDNPYDEDDEDLVCPESPAHDLDREVAPYFTSLELEWIDYLFYPWHQNYGWGHLGPENPPRLEPGEEVLVSNHEMPTLYSLQEKGLLEVGPFLGGQVIIRRPK